MNPVDPFATESEQNRGVPLQPGLLGQDSCAASPVAVFVVDDDPTVRQTLELHIESRGFGVECFASAEECLRALDSSMPECIVVDIGLPGKSGIELVEELHYKSATTPVIFFTGNNDATVADRAMRTGARNYCAKSLGPEALVACVNEVICTDRRDRQEFVRTQETSGRILELTPREREVLELLILGYTNRQVGILLGISSKTVTTHRASLMRKSQSDSMATLMSRWQEYKSGAHATVN